MIDKDGKRFWQKQYRWYREVRSVCVNDNTFRNELKEWKCFLGIVASETPQNNEHYSAVFCIISMFCIESKETLYIYIKTVELFNNTRMNITQCKPNTHF